MFDYGDNCPLTGMCYDYYLLKPIIDYYNVWCTYPEDFSLEDLMRQCYDNFFKSWHEEYEYWADNEDAIREELHHNQYENQLYYENGDVYVGQLNEGNYIPVYTSLSIIITNSHKLIGIEFVRNKERR